MPAQMFIFYCVQSKPCRPGNGWQEFRIKRVGTRMKAFSTRTFGKWILAGEHAVLRGSPALAFPLTARSLELEFEPGNANLHVDFRGEQGQELKLLFYGVIENAM